MSRTLKVLSFNTWMLRLPLGIDIAKDIEVRKKLIPQAIAETGADIVLLQEVWEPGIRDYFTRRMREEGYPYAISGSDRSIGNSVSFLGSAFTLKSMTTLLGQGQTPIFAAGGLLLSACAGSALTMEAVKNHMEDGLQIFSKYPLDSKVERLSFQEFTRPDECFVRKGALRVKAYIPHLGPMDLYNTHLGAVSFNNKAGNYHPKQSYRKWLQAKQLVSWIKRTRSSEAVVLGGDFNSHLFTKEYKLLSGDLGFQDTYRSVNGFEMEEAYTDSAKNHYKKTGAFRNSPDAVNDYLWKSPDSRLSIHSSHIVLKSPILSDHFGVLTVFRYS